MYVDQTRHFSAAAGEHRYLASPLEDLMSTAGQGHMMTANTLQDTEPYRLLAYAILPPRRCSVPGLLVLHTNNIIGRLELGRSRVSPELTP